MGDAPSEAAVSVLCHACGVSVGQPHAWRRHYAPGPCPTRLEVCRELVDLGLMRGPIDHLGQPVYLATDEGVLLAVTHMEGERTRLGLRRWLVQTTLDDVRGTPHVMVAESRSKARWRAVVRLADVVDYRTPVIDLLRGTRVTLDRRPLSELANTEVPR